jgi:hypothetical protein
MEGLDTPPDGTPPTLPDDAMQHLENLLREREREGEHDIANLTRLGEDMDNYMRFRARHEGVAYELTPEFFVSGFLAGCRMFFGIEVDQDADGVLVILGDEQQPDMLREWLDNSRPLQ